MEWSNTSNNELLEEIKNISKLLLLINSEKITSQLEKYVSTDERKMIWILLDGNKTNEDISKITGSKIRTIQNYKKILEGADLIFSPHGKPGIRKINFVPSEWLKLIPEIDDSNP